MPDESLLLVASEVRRKTLKILDGVSEDEARWTPTGLNNHILWHAGHGFTVVQHLAVAGIKGEPATYPDGWFDAFSWKSQPAQVKSWPKLSEVVTALQDQATWLNEQIGKLNEQQLSRNIGDAARPRTLRYSIVHGFHDEANHQGEMYMLKKMIARKM